MAFYVRITTTILEFQQLIAAVLQGSLKAFSQGILTMHSYNAFLQGVPPGLICGAFSALSQRVPAENLAWRHN
jgi:hypothetical protein